MMLSCLLGRAASMSWCFEKHVGFYGDFRGDTVYRSTLR
jgi:hypothetical protein